MIRGGGYMATVPMVTENKLSALRSNRRLSAAIEHECWRNKPKLKQALEFLRDHGRITPDEKRHLNFWGTDVSNVNQTARRMNLGIHLVMSVQGSIITCEEL